MSTVIFWFSMGLLGIIVLSKIPGLDHLVKPVISLMFTVIEAACSNLWAWMIFVIKTLVFSHIDLAKHLVLSSEQIDPTYGLREQYEKS